MPNDHMAPRWLTYGERTLYESKWVRLTQVDVQPPDGTRWWHHVVRLQTVAMAVVLDDQNQVLMMWRHRFVPDTYGWELPGGILEPGEDGAATAIRETEEETGWRPIGSPVHLVTFEPMPGMVASPHEVYLIRGAMRMGEPTDMEEAAHVEWIPRPEIANLIAQNKISGSGSLVGLLYILSGHAEPLLQT